jgi:hypothetical protein
MLDESASAIRQGSDDSMQTLSPIYVPPTVARVRMALSAHLLFIEIGERPVMRVDNSILL